MIVSMQACILLLDIATRHSSNSLLHSALEKSLITSGKSELDVPRMQIDVAIERRMFGDFKQ